MHITIKRFTDSRGVESVILKMDGTPLFWANLYATIEYRNAQKSPNTIEKVLRTIGMCYQWAISEQIDLDGRFMQGELVDIPDIDSLSYFLKLKSDSQKALINKTHAPSRNNIRTLESARFAGKKNEITAMFAGDEEIATRIRVAADFLYFLLKRRLGTFDDWTKDAENLDKFGKNSITYLKQLAPRVKSSSLNEDLEGLPVEEIEAAEAAFHPSSDSNPFRRGFHQHRNYLIWRLLFETGMRRHELVALKVEDVNYGEHRVVIRVSKTMARTVPISQTSADFFHEFVMEYWSKLPRKLTSHGYIFTRKDGGHIDEGSINLIFQTIREKVPNLSKKLTPHSLRRTWNDRFSRKIDTAPEDQRFSLEHEKQIRNRLMGWSSNSSQAERYAKRHIRKKADEIAENLANDLVEKTENNNE